MRGYSPLHLKESFRPDHEATSLQQDFGEMAPLCWCGSFQQEQTPLRRDPPASKMNPGFF